MKEQKEKQLKAKTRKKRKYEINDELIFSLDYTLEKIDEEKSIIRK